MNQARPYTVFPGAIIAGVPREGGGWQPLYMLNSPEFRMPGPGVPPDVDSLPSLLSVRTEEQWTLYTLILSDIVATDASPVAADSPECHRLKISISVPRGFSTLRGHTPYDILLHLRDTLIVHYMRPVGESADSFAFLSRMPGPERLEETLRRFPLQLTHTAHRPMRGQGIAYIRSPRIEEISRDVQYPELEKFSEAIISPALPRNLKALRLPDIPRRPAWTLLINAIPHPWPSGIDIHNDRIRIANPDINPEFEECDEVRFTIEQALEGKVEGVEADLSTETVSVEMPVRQRQKNLRLRLVAGHGLDPETDDMELAARNVVVYVGDARRRLSPDHTITLTGPEIGMELRFEYLGPDYDIRAIRKGGEFELIFTRSTPYPRPHSEYSREADATESDKPSAETPLAPEETIAESTTTLPPAQSDIHRHSRKSHSRTLLWIALAFAAGIAAGHYLIPLITH